MKVIFLDFDGVLNNQGSFIYENRKRKNHATEYGTDLNTAVLNLGPVNETFDAVCASNFQYILDAHRDAKIVYSTTWRNLFSVEYLANKLAEYGIDSSRVIGTTPDCARAWTYGDRTEEIAQYLDEHPEITNYVIIDDAFINGVYAERHVQTEWYGGGLTHKHSQDAIAYLRHPKAPRKPKEEVKNEADSRD